MVTKHVPAPGPQHFPVLLRRAWFGINQAFRRRIASTGSTPDHYTVLRTLAEAGPEGLTQCALAQRMSSDANTVTSLVRRLERAGLVARPKDPADRRARRLRLLPAGEQRLQELRVAAQKLLDEVIAVLPVRDRRRFLKQLELVANACRASIGRP